MKANQPIFIAATPFENDFENLKKDNPQKEKRFESALATESLALSKTNLEVDVLEVIEHEYEFANSKPYAKFDTHLTK